jgi:hypothetical protein
VISVFIVDCEDNPTMPYDATDSFVKPRSNILFPTTDKVDGGKGGGGLLSVDFLDKPDLDYYDNSGPQDVKGTNTNNKIGINDTPFYVYLNFSELDLINCGSESKKNYLNFLQTQNQPLFGLLGISVYKQTNNVVVNFTIEVGEYVYFLTTGGGTNIVDDSDPTMTAVTKIGGHIRIYKNPISRKGRKVKDTMICYGITDYEFTVSK